VSVALVLSANAFAFEAEFLKYAEAVDEDPNRVDQITLGAEFLLDGNDELKAVLLQKKAIELSYLMDLAKAKDESQGLSAESRSYVRLNDYYLKLSALGGAPKRLSQAQAVEIIEIAGPACQLQLKATGEARVYDVWTGAPAVLQGQVILDENPVTELFGAAHDGQEDLFGYKSVHKNERAIIMAQLNSPLGQGVVITFFPYEKSKRKVIECM
jgi:hypothetical protein